MLEWHFSVSCAAWAWIFTKGSLRKCNCRWHVSLDLNPFLFLSLVFTYWFVQVVTPMAVGRQVSTVNARIAPWNYFIHLKIAMWTLHCLSLFRCFFLLDLIQIISALYCLIYDFITLPCLSCKGFSSLFLQICRVEDISVEGTIKGTVVHFHRARTVVIHSSGTISASGLGTVSYLFC